MRKTSPQWTLELVLAHVSNAAADQPTGATRPYGSVFVRNLEADLPQIGGLSVSQRLRVM